mmetsp:Transcript_1351/g.3074  ORF Transcript_1351/g.3074 Transcript_1351/m.3074 type:complete len:273 (+) Transcript_1351:72-890(+)
MSCPACFSGALDKGNPLGSETRIAGLDVYVTSQEEAQDKINDAVVIITDVFGWRLPNIRLIADKMAAELEMRIYIPDFHDGWSPPSWLLDGWLDPAPTFWGRVCQWAWLVIRLPQVLFWIATRGDRAVVPRVERFLRELREKHNAERIIASGYCWGARYAVLAAGCRGQVAGFAITHPSGVKLLDLQRVQQSGALLIPDPDPAFPPSDVLQAKTLLWSQSPPIFFRFHLFPGMVHGFAVRGRSSIPAVREAREEALQITCEFIRDVLYRPQD